MRKRIIAVFVSALLTLGLMMGPAAADPSFGPGAGQGQGNNRPQDQGASCHPPGQTSHLPQCR